MKSLVLVLALSLLGMASHAQNFGDDQRIDQRGFDRGGDRGDWRGGPGGWHGGPNNGPGNGPGRPGGWPGPGNGGPGGPPPPPPGYPGNGGYGPGEQSIVCQSSYNAPVSYCNAGGPVRGARLIRQFDNSPCIQGRTWGYDRDYVWTQGGCRAEFAVITDRGGYPPPPPPPPPPRPPQVQTVVCNSDHYRFASCAVNGFVQNVQLQQQTSQSACIPGQTYGFRDNQVWVDRGCSGVFTVFVR